MAEEKDLLPFTQEVLDSLTYGAYLLRDSEGKVLYIGQGEVVNRLQDHFWERDKKKKNEGVASFKIIWCANKREAEELERELLVEHKQEHGEFPKYNRRK